MDKYCPLRAIVENIRCLDRQYHHISYLCLAGECAFWQEETKVNNIGIIPEGCGLVKKSIFVVQANEA
jgi:hypothetical protein